MPPVLACFGLLSSVGFLATPEPVCEPFDLADVRLLPGPLLQAQEKNREYLLWLDPDRLLHCFRTNAGLPAPGEPYGGWEAPDVEVRGHFPGHYLSALAMMYRSTGDPEMKRRADYMVTELAKCQEKLGGGYLSAFPASFWERLENTPQAPWAPYYTIHKIMAGLLDIHLLCGNKQALEACEGMAAYFKGRIDRIPVGRWDRILLVEFGGMSDVLHNLYAVTHNPNHLALANRFNHEVFLGPLAMGHDNLTGLHGNTQIPKVIAAARHYELTGDERYRKAAEFFWHTVVETRSWASGGTTANEAWGEPNEMKGTENQSPHETCKTHNMLKLTRHLFEWTADPSYADYYERAFLNGILGTQNPNDGQLIYYVFQGAGSRKQWGTPGDSFWCCYGTGIESFAKLDDSIFFHKGNELWVNLFLPARVEWREQGVTLTQETRFPLEPSTELTVGCARPTKLKIHLRIPAWVARRAEVTVNGKAVARGPEPGYVTLERTFSDGDRIGLTLPMALSSIALPGDPDSLAFRYGPLVLAGITPEAASTSKRPVVAPSVLTSEAAEPASEMEPIPGKPLHFRHGGAPEGTVFVPLSAIVEETYQVYWPVIRAGNERARQIAEEVAAAEKLAGRVVDEVVPSEPDEVRAHGLEAKDSRSGVLGSAHWRDAISGGWWSWSLKTNPEGPTSVLVTFWGSDVGNRTFDVQVEGETLATVTLQNVLPGQYFDREYAVPEELTRGKERLTVRFAPHEGNLAGGVFYCATLRP